MKKLISVVLIIVMLLAVSGCTTLEEVRADRAYWTSDYRTGLTFEGVEYRFLTSAYGDFQPITQPGRRIYIVDPDVPALLKEQYGGAGDITADGVFIYGRDITLSDTNIYCRADRYDEMKKRVDAGFTHEGYCYEYYDEVYDTQLYQLTDTEAALLDELLRIEPVEEVVSEKMDDYASAGDIQSCSKDMLFRKAYISLWVNDGEYYISTMEYRDYGTVYYLLRQVPEDKVAELKYILRHEPKNYNGWWGTEHTS